MKLIALHYKTNTESSKNKNIVWIVRLIFKYNMEDIIIYLYVGGDIPYSRSKYDGAGKLEK